MSKDTERDAHEGNFSKCGACNTHAFDDGECNSCGATACFTCGEHTDTNDVGDCEDCETHTCRGCSQASVRSKGDHCKDCLDAMAEDAWDARNDR